jgi:hypothetical protein
VTGAYIAGGVKVLVNVDLKKAEQSELAVAWNSGPPRVPVTARLQLLPGQVRLSKTMQNVVWVIARKMLAVISFITAKPGAYRNGSVISPEETVYSILVRGSYIVPGVL